MYRFFVEINVTITVQYIHLVNYQLFQLFAENVHSVSHLFSNNHEHATYNLTLFHEGKKIHSWGAAPLTTPNAFLFELLLLWSQPIMSPRYSALQKRMSFIMLTKQ